MISLLVALCYHLTICASVGMTTTTTSVTRIIPPRTEMAMRAFPSCIRNRLRSWFPRLQHHGLSLALFSPCLRIMTALTRVDLASRKVQKSPGSDQLASRKRRARTPDLHFLPPEALADNHRISAVVYSASPLLKSWSERSYVRATMPSKSVMDNLFEYHESLAMCL